MILKQSAIDCEIHRKLHSKEQPVIQCMRFDTTSKYEDLAYNPNFKTDEKDSLYLRNIVRKSRRLQTVKIKEKEVSEEEFLKISEAAEVL